MSPRTMLSCAFSLPLMGVGLLGCAESGEVVPGPSASSSSSAGAGGACECDCDCDCGDSAAQTSSTSSDASTGTNASGTGGAGNRGNTPGDNPASSTPTASVGGNGTASATDTADNPTGDDGVGDSDASDDDTTSTVGGSDATSTGSAVDVDDTGSTGTGGADLIGGSASTGGSSEGRACTDEPRPGETCQNAIDWGFCGQEWFKGYCEASCGVCTMPTSGTNGTNSDSGGAADDSDGSADDSAGGIDSSTGGTDSTTTDSTGSPTVAERVDNPYVGVTGYVNPEWKAKADAEPGGSRVSSNPTGVWMDRTAAIDGTGSSSAMGLRAHLDEAMAQGAGYIEIVIYNLPGRDCAALSSNGELGPTEIDRYMTEYIDPIVAIESDPAYSSLRIINIIEIDSLPNLVTNTGDSDTATEACDVMKANGNYQKGIQYALGELYKVGNTYNYVDAGHHGWIGWEDNFNESAALFYETASGAEGGVDTVTGFITNTANYSALEEPFLTLTEETRQSSWIDFNQYLDELSFAKAFRTKLVSLGFNADIGMIIDTSRNGWGGPDRPTAASSATDVDTMVEESRIERRIHAGNWCNQSGAGLGERPQVIDSDGIDAYVWIKPPGESDGASQYVENDQGKGIDGMCDPTYEGNARNGNSMSGALPDAPLSGAWFSAQFQELMANAYPPLE